MKKKGSNILTENVIFIVLNLVFLVILVGFLFLKTADPATLEEKYSKEIALMIDAARPGMLIGIDMKDAVEMADSEGWALDKVVSIDGNVVFVQLHEDGGHSYSFFNNVSTIVEVYANGRTDIKVLEVQNE